MHTPLRTLAARLVAVAVLALSLTACDAADPGTDAFATAATADPGMRAAVCHHHAGTGTYALLSLPTPAVAAHRRHGDGAPGEAVPTMEGFAFDAACVPQLATLFGDAVAVGHGTARTYVTVDAAGTPTAVGVAMTAGALSGLPEHPGDGHGMDDMHLLPMPAAVGERGILTDHVSLDWNPLGHEPVGLFTLPHFDVHFYTVPVAERMTWLPGTPIFALGATPPPAAYVPAGYVQLPGVVPAMGAHWIDPTDPTYAPGGPAFTEVFINGSFNGQMVFAEPMITKAYLESLRASGAVHEETLAQAAAVATTGLYPTTYSVRYDAARGQYRIELGGLVRRTAS